MTETRGMYLSFERRTQGVESNGPKNGSYSKFVVTSATAAYQEANHERKIHFPTSYY
jgi:hypothetical protein